jgi:hypothetical protein
MARDQPVTLDVPVQLYSASQNAQAKAKLLHVLAARALIREFEDHKPMTDTDKAEVLRLAVRYGLSSSQTSFVAVEEAPAPASTSPRVSLSTADRELADSALECKNASDEEEAEGFVLDDTPAFAAADTGAFYSHTAPAPALSLAGAAPTVYAAAPIASSSSAAYRPPRARMTVSRLVVSQPSRYLDSVPGLAYLASDSSPKRKKAGHLFGASPGPVKSIALSRSRFAESEPQAKKDDVPTSVAGLAQLQRTDGAFPPSKQIYAVVGGATTKDHFKALFSQSSALSSLPPSNPSSLALSSKDDTKDEGTKTRIGSIRRKVGSLRRSANPTKADEENPVEWNTAEILWATLLILAFLELKLTDEEDMWVLMAEKARTWIAAVVGSIAGSSPSLEGGDPATAVESMEAEARKVVEKL